MFNMTKKQQHEFWIDHHKKLKEINSKPIVLEWGPYVIWADGNAVKYVVYRNLEKQSMHC